MTLIITSSYQQSTNQNFEEIQLSKKNKIYFSCNNKQLFSVRLHTSLNNNKSCAIFFPINLRAQAKKCVINRYNHVARVLTPNVNLSSITNSIYCDYHPNDLSKNEFHFCGHETENKAKAKVRNALAKTGICITTPKHDDQHIADLIYNDLSNLPVNEKPKFVNVLNPSIKKLQVGIRVISLNHINSLIGKALLENVEKHLIINKISVNYTSIIETANEFMHIIATNNPSNRPGMLKFIGNMKNEELKKVQKIDYQKILIRSTEIPDLFFQFSFSEQISQHEKCDLLIRSGSDELNRFIMMTCDYVHH